MTKIRESQVAHQHQVFSDYTITLKESLDAHSDDDHTPFIEYLYRFGLVHMIQQGHQEDVLACICTLPFLRHTINQSDSTSEPLKFIRIVGINAVDDVYASMNLKPFIPLDEERLDQLHDVGKFLRGANLYKGSRNLLSWAVEQCLAENYPTTEKSIDLRYAFGLLLKHLGEYQKALSVLELVLKDKASPSLARMMG